jgi:PAS domain S-box-containing protein
MSGSRIRVLLVEGDESYASLVQSQLTAWNANVAVTHVRTLADARARLRNPGFEAILLDLALADGTGPGVVDDVLRAAPDVPIIVLTADADEEAGLTAVHRGAQDFLVKRETDARLLSRAVRYALERAAFRAELVRRERYFRALTEQAYDIVVVLATSGTFLYESPAVERVLGYPPGTLTGTNVQDLVHPEDRERAATLLRTWPDGLEGTDYFQFRLQHKDGRWRVVEALGRSLYDDPRNGIVVNARDVTDRVNAEDALRKTEEQLRQAHKMEAVGRLAGGIAHDFNNVLTAIFGYSDLLMEQLAGDDPKRADVEEIRRSADRAAALTRQLLAFSRKQVMQPRVIDLNTVVSNLERLLGRLVGEDVQLRFLPAADLWPVRADPGQMEQVLMNLGANARDAMPEGGDLTIETANRSIDEDEAYALPGLSPGEYVTMTVTDTGAGMPVNVQRHVFEPFFTTKEQGKGTGLGLATVYGIVKQSGGGIYLTSDEGQGTTFSIYLPRIREEAPQDDAATARPSGDERSSG